MNKEKKNLISTRDPVNDRETGKGFNAAQINALLQEDVASVSPGRPPAVAYDPVVDGILGAVADDGDGVLVVPDI